MHLNKYSLKTCFLVCILLVMQAYAGQNDPLQIIDLNNRPAEEMVPIIKPMLKPDDAITGSGYQLFIRTDAKTYEEVKRLLHVMDKAPKNLIISVRNDENIGSESTDFDLSGNYEIGDDSRVVIGNRPPKEGTRIHVNKSERSANNNIKHTVRVLEGGQAFITTGQIRPYEHRTIIKHPHGVSVYDNVDYEDLTSGFYVRPILTGNGDVTLHINPHYRSAGDNSSGSRTHYSGTFYGSRYGSNNGTIDVQEADTVITAKLGQWIQIGGVDTDAKTKESRILSSSRSETERQNSIYIKVDIEK